MNDIQFGGREVNGWGYERGHEWRNLVGGVESERKEMRKQNRPR